MFNVPFFIIHGKETMKWTKQKTKIKTIAGWYTPRLEWVNSAPGHRSGLGGPRISTSTWTQSISSFQLSAPNSQREKSLSKDDMTIMTMIHTYPF